MGKKEYHFKPSTSCDFCTWRIDNGRQNYLSVDIVNTLLTCLVKVEIKDWPIRALDLTPAHTLEQK